MAAYEDNITFLASGLTFDGLLWLLPLVLVALAVFGYIVGGGGDTVASVHQLFDRFLPAGTAGGPNDPFTAIEGAIARVVASRVPLLVYGLPAFLWFSMRLFGSVRAALNDVFDTEETRGWIAGKLLDMLLGIACAVLVIANTTVSFVVISAPWIGRLLAGLSAYGFALAAFFVVYKVAPSRRVPWDTALIASVVSALAFEIAKRLFAIYLDQFATIDRALSNTNVIALLLFVLWVYYTCVVFLAGGEVAETYELARRQREQRAILT